MPEFLREKFGKSALAADVDFEVNIPSMRISSAVTASPYSASATQAEQLRLIRTHLRSLGLVGARFTVVRDPATQRFVVQMLDPDSRTVLDQFPAENILKQLAGRQSRKLPI